MAALSRKRASPSYSIGEEASLPVQHLQDGEHTQGLAAQLLDLIRLRTQFRKRPAEGSARQQLDNIDARNYDPPVAPSQASNPWPTDIAYNAPSYGHVYAHEDLTDIFLAGTRNSAARDPLANGTFDQPDASGSTYLELDDPVVVPDLQSMDELRYMLLQDEPELGLPLENQLQWNVDDLGVPAGSDSGEFDPVGIEVAQLLHEMDTLLPAGPKDLPRFSKQSFQHSDGVREEAAPMPFGSANYTGPEQAAYCLTQPTATDILHGGSLPPQENASLHRCSPARPANSGSSESNEVSQRPPAFLAGDDSNTLEPQAGPGSQGPNMASRGIEHSPRTAPRYSPKHPASSTSSTLHRAELSNNSSNSGSSHELAQAEVQQVHLASNASSRGHQIASAPGHEHGQSLSSVQLAPASHHVGQYGGQNGGSSMPSLHEQDFALNSHPYPQQPPLEAAHGNHFNSRMAHQSGLAPVSYSAAATSMAPGYVEGGAVVTGGARGAQAVLSVPGIEGEVSSVGGGLEVRAEFTQCQNLANPAVGKADQHNHAQVREPSFQAAARHKDDHGADDGDVPLELLVDVPPRPASSHMEQLLVNCADAVDRNDLQAAHTIMQALNSMVSPHGTAAQRMAYYFLEGLAARIVGTGSAIYLALQSRSGAEPGPASKDMLTALLAFLEACPYANFGHVAANGAILEAFEGESHVHIIDFGITHGTQWPTLIEALAMRPGGPPHLRITGIDAPQTGLKPSSLQETGRRLTSFSRLMGVPFEFCAVTEQLENLSREQFEVRPGEVLAVNCLLRLHQLQGESMALNMPSPRNFTLQIIRSLEPRLVILVEQHTDHNLPVFRLRFREALHYFSALFDSLDVSLPWHSTERVLIEERVLGRKIVNIIACEGRERIERHESMHRWRYRMQRAGFSARPFSADVIDNIQSMLKRYREGYGLSEDQMAVLLTWRGQQLLAASTWACAEPPL